MPHLNQCHFVFFHCVTLCILLCNTDDVKLYPWVGVVIQPYVMMIIAYPNLCNCQGVNNSLSLTSFVPLYLINLIIRCEPKDRETPAIWLIIAHMLVCTNFNETYRGCVSEFP